MRECFTKGYDGLKWSIDTAKTVQQNMPVFSGFKSKMELAVMVVCKNMFSKIMEDNASKMQSLQLEHGIHLLSK